MRNILIIGAGRSTTSLIRYLIEKSSSENLHITIGDISLESAQKLTKNHLNAKGILLDVFNEKQREEAVKAADIVISMLPARFHIEVAKDCITFGKNLVTASYISDEMQALNKEVVKKGLVFMNEIGVDPGIDHMSAMQVIDTIRDKGGKLMLFESFTGGLIAPESDDNLWNYKFTWNPRNVVLAGQGGAAEFLQEGLHKYIPYNRLFRRTELIKIKGYGEFEVYANRNSLKYQKVYGFKDILTLYRGTIRRVGFSRAWNIFVQLGMTDDSYTIPNSENLSYREYVNLFLPYSPTDSIELKLRHNLKIDQDDLIWKKLREIGNLIGKYEHGIIDLELVELKNVQYDFLIQNGVKKPSRPTEDIYIALEKLNKPILIREAPNLRMIDDGSSCRAIPFDSKWFKFSWNHYCMCRYFVYKSRMV